MRQGLRRLALAIALLVGPARAAAQEGTPEKEAGPRAEAEGPRLTLGQLVRRAIRHPRATAERHAARAAHARVLEARGARFPQLEALAFGGPSPRIRCDNPECTVTSPKNVTINIAGVFVGTNIDAAQPLYTFGKLDSAIHAARRAAEAADFTREAVEGDLALRAARAYFGLKLARELIFMLEDGQDQIDKARKRLDKALEEGKAGVTVQDRLRLATLAAEVKTRVAEARQAEAIALAGVRALAEDERVDVDEKPLAPVEYELGKDADAYVARGQRDRPELRAGHAQVKAVHALARLERARWFPDLLLVGGLRFAYAQGVDNPPSAFANDPFNKSSARIGLAARWKLNPISHAGRVRRAKEEARRASSLYEAGLSAAEVEIRRAYIRAKQARARMDAAGEGEKAARGWVASVLQAEAIGTAEPKELADAYLAYFRLRARVLESIHDWNVATVELRRALGEYPPTWAGPTPSQ